MRAPVGGVLFDVLVKEDILPQIKHRTQIVFIGGPRLC
jgi:hypothetical protein